jgi:hypothetical protein
MTECPIHMAMDRRTPSLRFVTVRCGHVGDEYMHERRCAELGVWFLNRVRKHRYGADGLCACGKPELVSVRTAEEAETVWREMQARMLAGAPFNEPYSAGSLA